jgi:hypothetical protein
LEAEEVNRLIEFSSLSGLLPSSHPSIIVFGFIAFLLSRFPASLLPGFLASRLSCFPASQPPGFRVIHKFRANILYCGRQWFAGQG